MHACQNLSSVGSWSEPVDKSVERTSNILPRSQKLTSRNLRLYIMNCLLCLTSYLHFLHRERDSWRCCVSWIVWSLGVASSWVPGSGKGVFLSLGLIVGARFRTSRHGRNVMLRLPRCLSRVWGVPNCYLLIGGCIADVLLLLRSRSGKCWRCHYCSAKAVCWSRGCIGWR